jgi:hypothetical protein
MSNIMTKTPNEQYHGKNTKWAISWQKHQMSNIMTKHQMSNIMAKTPNEQYHGKNTK